MYTVECITLQSALHSHPPESAPLNVALFTNITLQCENSAINISCCSLCHDMKLAVVVTSLRGTGNDES